MKIHGQSLDHIYQTAFKLGPRCYIPTEIGVNKFFESLNASAANYSVLRWFENLPYVMDGEDIDILVEDADLARVFSLASRAKVSGVPIDVYGVSGKEFTSFNGVPYFPSTLASYILQNSSVNANGIRVPTDDAHLAGLAFHAVFHKDEPALNRNPQNTNRISRAPNNRLRKEIERLNKKSNWKIPEISLAGLDSFLSRSGFAPPPELREFFGRRNAYARQNLASLIAESYQSKNHVSAFFIRDAGIEFLESIRNILEAFGFVILRDQGLTHEQITEVSALTRGGNWSAGDAPKPGGLPVHLLLVLDEFPLPPANKDAKEYPFVQNMRVHSAKRKIREAWTSRVGLIKESNIVHSTDNGYTTEFAAKLILPEKEVDGIMSQKVPGRELSEKLEREGFARVPGDERASMLYTLRESAEAEGLTMVKVFRQQCSAELAVEEFVRALGSKLAISSPARTRGRNRLEFPATSGLTKLKMMSPQQMLHFRLFYLSCAAEGINILDYSPGGLFESAAGKLEFVDFNLTTRGKDFDPLPAGPPDFLVPHKFSGAFNKPGDQVLRRRSRRTWISSGWARATGIPFWMFTGNFGVKEIAPLQKFYSFYLSILDFSIELVARVRWFKNLPLRGLLVVGVLVKRLQTRSTYTSSLRFSFPKLD